MEGKKELIEMFYSVIAVTDNKQDAYILAEMFLKGITGQEREEILTELENRDSRFLGWDSQYCFKYTLKNVSNDALYLTRKVSELVRTDEYDIIVTLKRRL